MSKDYDYSKGNEVYYRIFFDPVKKKAIVATLQWFDELDDAWSRDRDDLFGRLDFEQRDAAERFAEKLNVLAETLGSLQIEVLVDVLRLCQELFK